jgi:uncharacterized protein (DUF1800 family)
MLDAASALLPYSGPWTARTAAHLMRRAGFGGSPDEIARLGGMPMNAAVDAMLDFSRNASLAPPGELYDPISDLRQLLGTMAPAGSDDMQRRALLKDIRRQERQSFIALQRWWLNRMLNAPAPLQEKLTLFFHGHFTSAAIQKGVTPQMIYAQNDVFRSNALGNLRDLTWNVSIEPAMLLYLDNARNQAQHPNENYARELMELFTLGIGNYTEADVRESARAWTGWVVVRRTGEARFIRGRHDDGMKTFLGQSGNLGGADIVDIIYKQPACAQFWAKSLLNYFVYNDPEPPLVDALARLLRKNGYALHPVMSTLLRSNVFYSSRAYRALVKSPVEFAVGTYKALGVAQIDQTAQRALLQMGQILFYPPNVAGWPGGSNWLTSQTVIARENFVAGLLNSTAMPQNGWLTSVPPQSRPATLQLVRNILAGDASAWGIDSLTRYLNGSGTSALGALSGENYDERVRGAAYLAMAMPAYQLN